MRINTGWLVRVFAPICLVCTAIPAYAIPVGYVFSAARPSTYDGVIYRSALDGSDRVPILTGLTNPGHLAVYGSRIYWSEQSSMTIRSANFDGSEVRTLFTTGHNTYDLEIDPGSGEFYRVQYLNHIKRTAPVTYQDILIHSVDYAEAFVEGIALNPATRQVFWVQSGNRPALRRCERNGTGVTDILTAGLISPQDVEYDPAGDRLYWVDAGTYGLVRAKPDGTQVTPLAGFPFYPQALAVDAVGGHIYVGTGGGVFRSGLDGSGLVQIQSTAPCFGVAVAYIPEPGSLAMLAAALLGLRRRHGGSHE